MSFVFGVGSTVDVVGISGTPGMTAVTVEQVFDNAIVVYKAAIGTVFLPLESIVYASVSANGTVPSSSLDVNVLSFPSRVSSDA